MNVLKGCPKGAPEASARDVSRPKMTPRQRRRRRPRAMSAAGLVLSGVHLRFQEADGERSKPAHEAAARKGGHDGPGVEAGGSCGAADAKQGMNELAANATAERAGDRIACRAHA